MIVKKINRKLMFTYTQHVHSPKQQKSDFF